MTGALHFQVHPCAAQELLIDPLPEGAQQDGALYPDGAHLKDLKEVRSLLYRMQRPAIAPDVRYFSLLHLVPADNSTRLHAYGTAVVGIPARLEGKGSRAVPQSGSFAHGRWRVQAGPGACVPPVQSCGAGRAGRTYDGGCGAICVIKTRDLGEELCPFYHPSSHV